VIGRAIRGVSARLDWGYFVAGAVMNYSVQRCDDGSWALHATLVNFDAFKLRQRPLIFIASHKDRETGIRGEWRWPVKTIDVGEGTGPREVQAVLGPQLPQMLVGRR
jgi:hypothetical protein